MASGGVGRPLGVLGGLSLLLLLLNPLGVGYVVGVLRGEEDVRRMVKNREGRPDSPIVRPFCRAQKFKISFQFNGKQIK